jgi:hypothetical protein
MCVCCKCVRRVSTDLLSDSFTTLVPIMYVYTTTTTTTTTIQVKRKIKKAYCPPEVVEGNPIVDYAKHIIFGYYGTITINCDGVSVIYYLLCTW